MKRTVYKVSLVCFGFLAQVVVVAEPVSDGSFRRGDANADGHVNLLDPLATITFLFGASNDVDGLRCLDAADADDNGMLNVVDVGAGLNFLFARGPSLAAPGPLHCGADPTLDGLTCERYEACGVVPPPGRLFREVYVDVGGPVAHRVSGDFDRDGRLDLVVANRELGHVQFVRGEGEGRFTRGASLFPSVALQEASSFDSGDFDADSILDLVVAVELEDGLEVVVLFGEGDGTFGQRQTLFATLGQARMAVDDFDGLAGDDVAVLTPETLSVFTDSPKIDTRSFTRHTVLRPAFDDRVIFSGDVDGTGSADLVLVRERVVFSLLNQGGGVFTRAAETPARLSLSRGAVVLADFNGDGCADLVGLEAEVGGVVRPGLAVQLGRCDGTFREPLESELGHDVEAISLAAGDLNGDGSFDLVAGLHVRRYASFLGEGDGTFRLVGKASGAGSFVSLDDFDGDGVLDLSSAESARLLAEFLPVFHSGFEYEPVLSGNGDGTFFSPVVAESGTLLTDVRDIPADVLPADFDGDGKLDLAVVGKFGRVRTYLARDGDPRGRTFEEKAVVDGTERALGSVATGDLDGDGLPDLVISGVTLFPQRFDVRFLRNTGDGSLVESGLTVQGIGVGDLATGDFDGDGSTDVLLTTRGRLALYSNTHAGFFESRVVPEVFGVDRFAASRVVPVDLDHDGALDIVALGVNQESGAHAMRVFWNLGEGVFGDTIVDTPQLYFGSEGYRVSRGDFNGDGRHDLIVGLADGEGVEVYLGDGSRGFEATRRVDASSRPFVVSDLDLDGRSDVVFSAHEEMFVTVLRAGGGLDAVFQAPETYGIAEKSFLERAFSLHDADGDGDDDFVYSTAWGAAALRNRTLSP